MNLRSPSEIICLAISKFFARFDQLCDEGLGPIIAIIGVEMMFLSILYFNMQVSK